MMIRLLDAIYTSSDVNDKIGIKRVSLEEYKLKKFFIPTIAGKGAGYRNLFSPLDLVELRFFRVLVDGGMQRYNSSLRSQAFSYGVRASRASLENLAYVVFAIPLEEQDVYVSFFDGEMSNLGHISDQMEFQQVEIYNLKVIVESIEF